MNIAKSISSDNGQKLSTESDENNNDDAILFGIFFLNQKYKFCFFLSGIIGGIVGAFLICLVIWKVTKLRQSKVEIEYEAATESKPKACVTIEVGFFYSFCFFL